MDQWFKFRARNVMSFVAMNLGMAAYEYQKYYTCEEQYFTAIDHMKMAVGIMDQPREVCPTLDALQMIILGNVMKTGAMLTVDVLAEGAKKLYKFIQDKRQEAAERREKFYDVLETDDNRLPFIYECIDNKKLPNYSVNHLFTVMREERLDFAKVRYILAGFYAICLEKGEKKWGKELRMRSGRFFRGCSFHQFFPLVEGFY